MIFLSIMIFCDCVHIFKFSYIYYQILLHSREHLFGPREYIYWHKRNVGRNRNVRGAGEGSEDNGEHYIRNWRDDTVTIYSGRKLS